MNLNLENVRPQAEPEAQPVAVRRSPTIGALSGVAVGAAAVVFVVFGSWEWAVLLMLFAIYLAAMR